MNTSAVRLCLRCSVVILEHYSHPVRFIIRNNTLHHHWRYRYSCSSAKSSHIGCADSNNLLETDEFEDKPLYGDVNFSEITSDPEQLVDLKMILLEMEVMYQSGEDVPRHMSRKHWAELLALGSRNQRMKYVKFLRRNEIERHKAKMKQAELNMLYREKKASQPLEDLKLTTSSPINYSLRYNSLFFRFNQARINRYADRQLFNVMRFGSHIVMDCSYEPFMPRLDLKRCAAQFLLSWSYNREQLHPYHIMFCNVNPDGLVMKKFCKLLPQIQDPAYPFFQTSKSYLDLYPKERLVYLTENSNNTLLQYDPNDIYIIGGFVDQCRPAPLSFVEAKKHGLRTAKFPLDVYLNWAAGGKSLTLNQVLAIMIDVKDGKDWSVALKHVPYRKIQGFKENPTLAYQTNRKIESCARVRQNPVSDRTGEDS